MQKLISFLLAAICVVLSLLWYFEGKKVEQVKDQLADAEKRMGLLQITLRQCRTPADGQLRQEDLPPWRFLDLSGDQKVLLREVFASVDRDLKPLSDEAQKQAGAFRSLISQEGSTPESLAQARESMVGAVRTLGEKKKELLDERLKGVLTEEQMKKFREGGRP